MTKGLHKDSLQKIDNPHQWMIDDAEQRLILRIKAEIERQRKEIRLTNTGEMKVVGTPTQLEQGWLNALSWMEKVLDTLQEQPVELPITFQGDLAAPIPPTMTNPQDRLRFMEHWRNRHSKEQPVCEALVEEIDKRWKEWISEDKEQVEGVLPKSEFAFYARHFYELGRQSKKRELLPMIERICVSCPEKVKAESVLNKFISKNCIHCSIEHCPGVKACYTSSNEQLQ